MMDVLYLYKFIFSANIVLEEQILRVFQPLTQLLKQEKESDFSVWA